MNEFSVLVVDDEQEFRELTVKRLNRKGLQAEGAENGEQALAILTRNRTDIVLLDVKMPGMDGIEVLRKIRALYPLIEVVMLTGHASIDSGIEGIKLGAFDYLMKPIEFEPLIEKLTEAYNRRQMNLEKNEKAKIKEFMSMPT